MQTRNQISTLIKGDKSINKLFIDKEGIHSVENNEPVILMIEDNEILLELFNHRFQTLPFRFIGCSNGWEGLSIAKNECPDIILLDLMLPGLPGLSVLKSIRESTLPNQPKIIILSSKNRENNVEEGFKLGADDYMTKPFLMKEVLVRIQRLLARKN